MFSAELKKLFFITRVRNWYARFERPISSFSLVSGFVFDALTLKRVDLFLENFWVIIHLLIVAVCIILIDRHESGEIDSKDPAKIHFWLINVLQFFFGGLLSTYLVFYFRSGSLAVSWPFFLFLAAAFVANESFKKHYSRLSFQISLFFFSLFSFAIFIVPVVLHRIGPDVFLLSGAASLVSLLIFLLILRFFAKEKFSKSRKVLRFSIAGIFLAVNAFYFLNLIPPIPLSLKDAGIYHSITKNADGNYTVEYENKSWLSFFNFYDNFHEMPGDTAYAYSAIFSPALLNTTITHEWQTYNESSKKWITATVIEIPLTGGREGGYRTYSFKNDLAPGKWRVNVETKRGEVLGRLRFNVILQTSEPTLKTDIKN